METASGKCPETSACHIAACGRRAIVEFVPKHDPQVKKLLASREDIFPNYTREGFKSSFGAVFDLLESNPVPDTDRVLYLMERRR